MNQLTRTVAINVDMQNDFCPGGPMGVTGGTDVIQPMNEINQAVRDSGGQVIFTRDWHPKVTNHFIPQGGPWPPHCIAETKGAQIHKDVVIKPSDIIVNKGTAKDEDALSGFEGRALDGRTLAEIVTPRPNEDVMVILGGLATDYCDKATALDGLKLPNQDQLTIYAVTDAMKAVDVKPGDGDAAIEEMRQAGIMMTTAREVIERIAV